MVFHKPVLKEEALTFLVTAKKGIYLDGTLGGGGHSEAILKNIHKSGRLIALDLDNDAIHFSRTRLKHKNFLVEQANFKNLGEVLKKLKINRVHGILLDLGVSSYQIDTAEKGFSYRASGKLDMRMNSKQQLTAHEIANTFSEEKLCEIFKKYGEERRYRAISRVIIREREKNVIETTTDLQEIISVVLPYQNRVKSLSRIFQALRIAVNEELENLKAALESGLDYLTTGGRLVVISYHSLEDRIVKNFFKQESRRCVCPPDLPICVCGEPGRLKILTKRSIQPSKEEVQRNPRSRSARLRTAEMLEERAALRLRSEQAP
ncbi:16S rRNA (cytosine(1402)-N(4))-methyltransferase RsmH [candidate division KSB1 bacterium]|nr:16S rRNA (cytosine(1402)-N(4))-methyltransferase RsmH [candidate division KSB1 bacterium]